MDKFVEKANEKEVWKASCSLTAPSSLRSSPSMLWSVYRYFSVLARFALSGYIFWETMLAAKAEVGL